MNTRKRRLGRGLDALLGDTKVALAEEPAAAGGTQLRQLPLDALRRGQYQPRTRMDEESLASLAQSIKTRGMVQPILARPLETGDYEIIAGERRWRAARLAGLETVPVLSRDIPDDGALAVALIENIQREDLNPIEEAAGLRRLLDEFGMTHEQVADGIGRSRSAVTNLLRLLALNPGVKELLEQGRLEMGHGRALLALADTEQDNAAKEVVAKGLSVRQTEELVRRYQQRPRKKRGPAPARDPDILRLEEQISERLGAPVNIQDRAGKGRLVIEYHSLDELDGILGRIH